MSQPSPNQDPWASSSTPEDGGRAPLGCFIVFVIPFNLIAFPLEYWSVSLITGLFGPANGFLGGILLLYSLPASSLAAVSTFALGCDLRSRALRYLFFIIAAFHAIYFLSVAATLLYAWLTYKPPRTWA
jgi:hypothetical protein